MLPPFFRKLEEIENNQRRITEALYRIIEDMDEVRARLRNIETHQCKTKKRTVAIEAKLKELKFVEDAEKLQNEILKRPRRVITP